MERTATRLAVAATPSAPALVLRPWRSADASALIELYKDDALRRWTNSAVDDPASAAQWIRHQQRSWATGDRFGFAVAEIRGHGSDEHPVGHVVLKDLGPDASSAQVGYWTAAHARGRGVAPRALLTLTDWAFATFLPDGLIRLELLHQVDNTASCRVAQKARYELISTLPAAPPTYPLEGHLHVRMREGAGT